MVFGSLYSVIFEFHLIVVSLTSPKPLQNYTHFCYFSVAFLLLFYNYIISFSSKKYGWKCRKLIAIFPRVCFVVVAMFPCGYFLHIINLLHSKSMFQHHSGSHESSNDPMKEILQRIEGMTFLPNHPLEADPSLEPWDSHGDESPQHR